VRDEEFEAAAYAIYDSVEKRKNQPGEDLIQDLKKLGMLN
jgi:hypothetical protein